MTARLVSARRADLAGVVPQPAALPEHHQPRVLSRGGIHRDDQCSSSPWIERLLHASSVVKTGRTTTMFAQPISDETACWVACGVQT